MLESDERPEGILRTPQMKGAGHEREEAQRQGDAGMQWHEKMNSLCAELSRYNLTRDECSNGELSQNEHDDQGPMGMLPGRLMKICGQCVARKVSTGLVVSGGMSQVGIGSPRQELAEFAVFDDFLHVDDPNGDGLMRTGLDTRGGFADFETAGTHVAFPDDAFLRVILRNIVGTGQCAILAADALVVEVLHDPRDRIFDISVDGTPDHARRFETVMTRRCHVLQQWVAAGTPDQQTDISPGLLFVEAIQRVAGRDARLTARTPIKVDLKGVLLARLGWAGGHQRRVILGLKWGWVSRLPLSMIDREAFDCGELLLVSQKICQQRRTRGSSTASTS